MTGAIGERPAIQQVDEVLTDRLTEQLSRLRDSSRTADAFANSPERLSAWVLARHSAEHVIRIRNFRPLDAEATRLIARASEEAAQKWASYSRSEAVHDRYYLRDLKAMGFDRAAVDRLQPLPATSALLAFIRAAMEAYGALPVVLYSFWTEKNSDVGTRPIIKRIRARFGEDATRGASAHRALDERLDHDEMVVEVLATLINDDLDLIVASEMLATISDHVAAYFLELEEMEDRQSRQAT